MSRTPEFTTHNLPTSQLQVGDVVRCHGMRCLITHPLNSDHRGRPGLVYWTAALVTNRQDVPYDMVPRSFTRPVEHEDRHGKWEEHRWTIQGNDLARWCVERPVAGWQRVLDNGCITDTCPQPVIATQALPGGGTAQLRPSGLVDAVNTPEVSISGGHESLADLVDWLAQVAELPAR